MLSVPMSLMHWKLVPTLVLPRCSLVRLVPPDLDDAAAVRLARLPADDVVAPPASLGVAFRPDAMGGPSVRLDLRNSPDAAVARHLTAGSRGRGCHG